ncbi:uncharacterized protein F4822DRAFT_424938 [Hypoxylon trugodes]|uniref:uncharacterized protein n=1 Tax=Hypoxylon trugodes TaxID=326681 RepID=UPI00218EB48F|nr:uncharacterized protein F4822DRAFT_424938 [Hypoxylon trugodes]KAI1394460.1 hypothetical protein F4822DRAFT_424938 [Hypoxylon trugodes]
MDSEDIDAWVNVQKKLPRPPTDEELKAFREFLDAPIDEVWQHAKKIAAFYLKPFEESRIDVFWFVFGDAVNHFTSQNDKLAELALKLQRLPDGKGILGPDPWWSDLPWFNNFWTEWMQFQFEDLPRSGGNFGETCQANVNRNTFLAKLTASMGKVAVLDQRERGGQVLKLALERRPVSEPHVLAAEPWIAYCADSIYDRSLQGGNMSWEYPHNGTTWGVQKGWSQARWRYWRKRFQEISKTAKNKMVQNAAKECAERMSAIEEARN